MKANELDERKVMVLWCNCFQSIEQASTIDHYNNDLSTKRHYNQAKKWGRKVEEMTLTEFKSKPFMDCNCFSNH